ncbi:MAG: threonine ammonia-lyase [Nitrospirae bacterium]|nr:threonine ammonia-lyase [Nitrospirota bacterium]MCL5978427.1 threonine ammonia-lyase [Nitrospirota bacterium]
MTKIDLSSIQDALKSISPYVHRTPLIYSNSFSKIFDAEVYIKAENLQKTGSFKVRGAFNKLRKLREGRVIAASMGNHAQGVAFAAMSLGMEASIVMPSTASIVKQEATKGYGAEVILYGESFSDALNYAVSQKGYEFIHAFDDEEIIAGQGTIGLEIAEDIKDADVVIVPVGGGGLISGISIAVKSLSPKVEIIGVQTVSATSAYDSFHSKKPVERIPQPTLADGIAVGKVGGKTIEIINKHVDDIIKVSEESIAMSVLLFLERKKLVVEGAGAVPLAALIEQRERFRGKKIVLVVSGGNIDFTLIDRIIHKGLVSSGRIGVFKVIVDDVPGGLHKITGIIAAQRGNILNVVHDRLAGDVPVGKTLVTFTVETKGRGHFEEIISAIKRAELGVIE